MNAVPVSPPAHPSRNVRFLRAIARGWSILVVIITVLLFLGPELHAGGPAPLADWPVFGLLLGGATLGLLLAWKWEGLGGALCLGSFLLGMLVYFIMHGYWPDWFVTLILLAVWVAPGIWFLVCWWASRKKS